MTRWTLTRCIQLMCAAALCLSGNLAHARKGVNQGFVDLKLVLHEVCDGRRAKKRLRYYKDRFQKQLNRQKARLIKFRKEHPKRKYKSPEAKREVLAQMRKTYLGLQRSYANLSRKLKQMEAHETKRILMKARRLIRKLALQHKLIFVFEKAQSSLLYARKDRDFTKELIRLYRKAHCSSQKTGIDAPKAPSPRDKKLRLRLKELGIDTQ